MWCSAQVDQGRRNIGDLLRGEVQRHGDMTTSMGRQLFVLDAHKPELD
jgi:hypothetical protein